MIAPIIPGLTDHEVPAILEAAAEAGAQFAGYTVVRLPYAVAPLFERWLEEHFPDRKEKVLGRIRHLRGGEAAERSAFQDRGCAAKEFSRSRSAIFSTPDASGPGSASRPEAIDRRLSAGLTSSCRYLHLRR